MALTILQMFAQATATADGIASIDVPEDGEIVGIDWDMVASAGFGDLDNMQIQLSFLASSQFTTNDARGAISSCGIGVGAITTSGVGGGLQAQKFVWLTDGLDVAGGERLHLHSLRVGVATTEVRCLVHLKTRKARARRTSRRR